MHVRILVRLHLVKAKQVDESVQHERARRLRVHGYQDVAECVYATNVIANNRDARTECFCSIFLLFLVVMRSTGIQTKRQEYFNVLFIYATFCIYSQQFTNTECTGITIKSQTEKEKPTMASCLPGYLSRSNMANA